MDDLTTFERAVYVAPDRPTTMHCKACRGTNVTRDCTARWNGHAWEVAGELDNYDCDDCGEVDVAERWADTGEPCAPDLDLFDGEMA